GYAPGAVQVGVHHAAPVAFGHVEEHHRVTDAGVVDQDIHHTPLLFRLLEGALDAVAVGHVHGHCQGLGALRLQLRYQCGQPVGAPRGNHHPSSGPGQGAGKVGAQAAGGAGNQRGLAGQIKTLCNHQFLPLWTLARVSPIQPGRSSNPGGMNIGGSAITLMARVAPRCAGFRGALRAGCSLMRDNLRLRPPGGDGWLAWLRHYRAAWLSGDLVAGLVTAIMIIPQSMAYAMLAGLPVQIGLYASLLPLIGYALFGTSMSMSVGPVAVTALMTVALLGPFATIGSAEYLQLAIWLALLSGVLLFVLGLLRMGFLANFLSHPVISGFISGASIL